MRRCLMAAGAAALTLAATMARAEDATGAATSDDVRCMIVAFTLAGSQDSTAKAAGGATLVYYLGRIDGRTPGVDLEARLREEIPKVTADTYLGELQRCGAALKARTDGLQDIGKRLQADASAPPAAPKP